MQIETKKSVDSLNSELAERDRELVVTRVFDAPLARLFEAWTQPEQLISWWGPVGFTATFHEIEITPGGRWRFTMHEPGGEDYENLVVFGEIVPPSYLTYQHSDPTKDSEPFETTVTFQEHGPQTRLTVRMLFATQADQQEAIQFGFVEGCNSMFDHLAEFLAQDEGIVLELERYFNASREKVYRAWTESGQFSRWFGPYGSSIPYCKLDVKPGGTMHFCCQNAGQEVWVGGVYRDVVPLEQLAFDWYFSDEAGGRVGRPGFWHQTHVVVRFTELDGKTRVHIRQTGLEQDQGETQGWNEGLDQLEEMLRG